MINMEKLKQYLANEDIMEFNSMKECMNWFNTYDYANLMNEQELKILQGKYGFNIGKKRYHILFDEALDVWNGKWIHYYIACFDRDMDILVTDGTAAEYVLQVMDSAYDRWQDGTGETDGYCLEEYICVCLDRAGIKFKWEDSMKKYSSAVEDRFQNVIKKSWTWDRLTDEEQKRFVDMNVFDRIKGNDKTRIEWLDTIYESFLAALGYKPIGWRETDENVPLF